ncbi:hypothetical protein MKD04_05735 [[Clostridium] innocuum]|nr:hypothetical protein [[Clostridium] innocuum]MCR0502920.1 hypothetical protein [[Clostridium] innocuum]DAY94049.1 MAG TPA: protein of unknown function (DUF5047) [Caudoviricetes sp.]
MYPVSDAFLQAIESNARSYYWTGEIVTVNHSTYEFGNEDIVKGSGYITRSACGSSEIELGAVYAAELGITLFSSIDRYTLDGAEIRLFFHLNLADGTVESIPMGVFEVSEANRTVKCLELKAYDYMLRFDKTLNIESSSGTPYNFLHTICTECKVAMAQTQAEIDALPNGRETLGIYSDNDIETFRDLLYYVAQVLGCVCQIDREGKLVLLPYGNTPAREVKQTQRYDSSYSDFVTRYTAVSSTNKITEEAEYYALTPDDGLTMNLGVNPLLQFGLKTTRARLITNILNAISIVEYVPFDSSTIGNPALDPMDCLTFSGGHADAAKVSCITSITYKINGKHTLKCVGKNPKLAEAKSKNDKNITGLLNQVEENKTVVYDFVNVSPYEIGSSPTEVLAITFVSKETTSAMFLAEVLLNITADEEDRKISGTAVYEEATEDEAGEPVLESVEKAVEYRFTDKAHPDLEVLYKINGDEVENFYPTQICHEGKHILTLFFPISSVEANSENTFSMYLKMTGGRASIAETQIRATISGQGLVAGIGDWNGRISVTETFDVVPLNTSDFGYDGLTDAGTVTFPRIILPDIVQQISQVPILSGGFLFDALNERVTAVEVIKTFTMDKNRPGAYDVTVIELTEEGAFRIICDYVYVSAEESINSGQLQHLFVDTTPFERVESQEVVTC